MLRVVPLLSTHERHHAHPGLEAGDPQSQLGENQERDAEHDPQIAVVGEELVLPVGQVLRLGEFLLEPHTHDDEVQHQVRPYHDHRDIYGLLKALEEYPAEHCYQQDGEEHNLVPEAFRHERVINDVYRGVRSREGDRDHEVGGDEAEQYEHRQLTGPEREQTFEHGDRALPVWTLIGDPAVHRHHRKQGQEHDEHGGDGREGPGGERRDAWYVAQGGEIVHAGQAYHLPPWLLSFLALPRLRAFHLLYALFEQPVPEAPGRTCRDCHQQPSLVSPSTSSSAALGGCFHHGHLPYNRRQRAAHPDAI